MTRYRVLAGVDTVRTLRSLRLVRFLRTMPLVVGLAIVPLACGDDDGGEVRTIGGGDESGTASGTGTGGAECEPVGDAETADSTVDVALGEWYVRTAPAETEAGRVHFLVENQGEEPHELVVVRGVAPGELPLGDDGALDEEGLPRGALVGEVEPFPGGGTCDGTFALDPGDYTLLCNIVEAEEDGTVEAHLAEGMVTEFTVG